MEVGVGILTQLDNDGLGGAGGQTFLENRKFPIFPRFIKSMRQNDTTENISSWF